MSYRCSIYGLGVLTNKEIPGVPSSHVDSVDLNITLGSLPSWVNRVSTHRVETTYTAEYFDASGKPMLRVFRVLDGQYYHFQYADDTEFLVNSAGTEVFANWNDPLTLEDTATYLLGPVMGFVMLLRGVVCLHASAVAIGNQALAIVGPAGSGKSTTAAALSARGYSVVAEDVVTLDDVGNHFLVQPAYPCIRLWPSSVKALFGTETYLPKLTPNWNKCYLDLTKRPEQFQQHSVELAAIYFLSPRSDTSAAPLIEILDKSVGLMSLVANTYATKLMDKQMRAREFRLLTRVLNNVPLRRVTPHTSSLRIPDLCNRILDDFATLTGSKAPEQVIHV